jgi:ferredoxin
MADEQCQIARPDRFVNEAGGARQKEERIEREQDQRTLERAVGL